MKILFVGNSQLSCLKMAFDESPSILDDHDTYFYVFPGGEGPSFTIENNKLEVIKTAVNTKFPPRVSPEKTKELTLNSYDAIIVSALGYVDGGFYHKNPVVRQGVLYAFGPKPNNITNRLLSKECYRRLVCSYLQMQHGFQFLFSLRKNFSKRIIVQPFSLMSTMVRDHPDWPLNQMYKNPHGAHAFFSGIRDEVLINSCKQVSASLLPYPNSSWKDQLFTPVELMGTIDGLHPLASYGKMVLNQVADAINN